jgi:hypothetical protein
MNKNKIDKILGLFDKYRVVIVKINGVEKDELVTIASPSDVIGESDNEVLYLGWFDENGDEYKITKFSEGGLDGAIINDNGNLVVQDTEGDSIEIQFQEIRKVSLVIQNIE